VFLNLSTGFVFPLSSHLLLPQTFVLSEAVFAVDPLANSCGLARVLPTASCGLIEPLALKVCMVDAVLELLAQLLRIDAVHVVKSSSSNQVGDHTCFD
jgi:hypothetical protein